MTAHPAATIDFRSANPTQLAWALRHARQCTLATFAAYEEALYAKGLAVPYHDTLNPPLWELGHVAWFQAYWLERNPERHRGPAADPEAARFAPRQQQADAWYDSGRVPHATRWELPLPNAGQTRDELAATLEATLALLEGSDGSDNSLYFHRLCLAHEDMHHEAAVYMAQSLGIPLADSPPKLEALPEPGPALELPPGQYSLGTKLDRGFKFDNECGVQHQALPGCRIDAQVLRWRDFLPFVETGGYADSRWWPGPAAAWRAAPVNGGPRYLTREGSHWSCWRHGQWQSLDLDEPACHLSAFEAEAWCAWAGRRLPTEAEWEQAALMHPEHFRWGAVWEWTASKFGPFNGFVAHPYRDYSAPWFGTRRVLRGASAATQRRQHHWRYRNFFTPHRNDIFAGFRSCSA